jgi:hypothetical protein
MDSWELYTMLLDKFGEIPDPRYQPKKFKHYIELLQHMRKLNGKAD